MTPRALGACLGWKRTERLKGRTVAGSPWQRYSRRYSTSSTAGKTRRARIAPSSRTARTRLSAFVSQPPRYPSRHGHACGGGGALVTRSRGSAVAACSSRRLSAGPVSVRLRQLGRFPRAALYGTAAARVPRTACDAAQRQTPAAPTAARPLCEHVLRSHPARGRIVVAAELVPKRRVTRANGCRVLSGAEPVRVRTRARRARAKAAGGRRKANRREGLRAAGACVQAAHEAACIRARVRVRAQPRRRCRGTLVAPTRIWAKPSEANSFAHSKFGATAGAAPCASCT